MSYPGIFELFNFMGAAKACQFGARGNRDGMGQADSHN
jgi:hypothetical protein